MMQKNSLFALLVLVLLMQSVLLVTAPHPTIGSSVLKSSSVPTPGAVVVGMGIAAAGAAAVAVNSSLASSSEGTEQHDGNDTSPLKTSFEDLAFERLSVWKGYYLYII